MNMLKSAGAHYYTKPNAGSYSVKDVEKGIRSNEYNRAYAPTSDYREQAAQQHDKRSAVILTGRLYLDGNISVEEDSQSIKDRKNLSANGYLEVTLMITPKGNIHNNPVLSFRGLPVYEKDEFIYGLEEEIDKTTRSFKLGSYLI